MPDRGLPDEAQLWVGDVKKVLARHDLERGFRGIWTSGSDGTDELRVRNSAPIVVRSWRPGVWTVHVSWTFRRVPDSTEITVWQSSVGLSVRGLDFAPEKVCLVRYDVDHGRRGLALSSLGRHLNVLQPSPLKDHVHFPIPGEEDEWNVPELLELLLSSMVFRDVVDRL